jgi:hypothetical protein
MAGNLVGDVRKFPGKIEFVHDRQDIGR